MQREQKVYEFSGHTGDVYLTTTDRTIPVDDGTEEIYTFLPDVNSTADFYPFGMQKPGRFNNSDSYRYAFQGMETDGEKTGNHGGSYTTEFRQYDPRLGRWLSLDPLMAKFPHMSPYVAFDNNPIYYTDPYGLESVNDTGNEHGGSGEGGEGDPPGSGMILKEIEVVATRLPPVKSYGPTPSDWHLMTRVEQLVYNEHWKSIGFKNAVGRSHYVDIALRGEGARESTQRYMRAKADPDLVSAAQGFSRGFNEGGLEGSAKAIATAAAIGIAGPIVGLVMAPLVAPALVSGGGVLATGSRVVLSYGLRFSLPAISLRKSLYSGAMNLTSQYIANDGDLGKTDLVDVGASIFTGNFWKGNMLGSAMDFTAEGDFAILGAGLKPETVLYRVGTNYLGYKLDVMFKDAKVLPAIDQSSRFTIGVMYGVFQSKSEP